jgi:hypothetical protein
MFHQNLTNHISSPQDSLPAGNIKSLFIGMLSRTSDGLLQANDSINFRNSTTMQKLRKTQKLSLGTHISHNVGFCGVSYLVCVYWEAIFDCWYVVFKFCCICSSQNLTDHYLLCFLLVDVFDSICCWISSFQSVHNLMRVLCFHWLQANEVLSLVRMF